MTRLILDEEDFKIDRGFIITGLFRIGDLEPAPPKDWTPYCYDESKKVCTMLGLVNEPPKCWKDCPYRKKDD